MIKRLETMSSRPICQALDGSRRGVRVASSEISARTITTVP
jgi:hypothetical protein